MLNHPTLEMLKSLKLHGMAAAFEEQLQNPSSASLSFEERFAILVDRERLFRENGRTSRLLRRPRAYELTSVSAESEREDGQMGERRPCKSVS